MIYIILNLIPAIAICIILQLLFHELGHMTGGLVTEWRLIYIQLFHIVLSREEKRYRLKLVSTYGCQCVMYPATKESGALLYTG